MSTLIRGERPALTRSEQWLRWLGAGGVAVIALSFGAIYAYIGIFDKAEYPYAVNSVAKDLLLAGLALLVFWDLRRWAAVAVPLIVAAHVVMPIMLLATLNGTGNGVAHTWILPGASTFRWTWLASDVLVVVVLLALHRAAIRSRYDLRYLTPSGFRALIALAEVLVLRQDREIAPAEVGARVDRYLASFRAREKYKIRLVFVALAYWPLTTLHPPFHLMSVDRRQRWVERRFLGETRDYLVPAVVRNVRRAAIRTAQQFCFFGYYGDPRAAKKAGYIPFSQREGYDDLLTRIDRRRPSVACLGSGDVAGESLNAQIVVVGSGAAGSMLAYELADRGCEVLLLERGRHVDPSTFTENEAVQLSELYADGALTLSKDFRFQVAQGMCVGGGTVVNNAVCMDLPESVLDRWNGPEHEAGLDRPRLREAFVEVRDFLQVTPITSSGGRNHGAQHLVDAIRNLEPGDRPGCFRVMDCNISDCLGSGYCNIGCKFGKKLSALDWTLPRAQRTCSGSVRVLPECRVEKILMRGGRAAGVQARLDDGRRLTVRATTVVLSAGAIASSIILQRSRLGEGRAGRSLAFNVGSPVTLDFSEELHSERGAQITHYFVPADGGRDGLGLQDGLVLETWFNPIVTQSLFMPGWFEEHWRNMRRYANMTCLGVVVGTESNASVRATRTGVGVKLDYRPTDGDFVKLKQGVRLACKVGLAAGALRAMPATFLPLEITCERDLALIETAIGHDQDININSSHPQGGNPMSSDPKKGVVDPRFRVYGTENVYVCDASVFPSSMTASPQLTVMALAAYAADEIGGRRRTSRQGEASMSHA